jgi:hypothetical protein
MNILSGHGVHLFKAYTHRKLYLLLAHSFPRSFGASIDCLIDSNARPMMPSDLCQATVPIALPLELRPCNKSVPSFAFQQPVKADSNVKSRPASKGQVGM